MSDMSVLAVLAQVLLVTTYGPTDIWVTQDRDGMIPETMEQRNTGSRSLQLLEVVAEMPAQELQ